ncbi:unnamed protein product, partial [Adineta steineri]
IIRDNIHNIPATNTYKDEPWKNPYWKDQIFQSSAPNNQPDKSINNRDSKDIKSHIPTSTTHEQNSWSNPYWKNQTIADYTSTRQQDVSRDIPISADLRYETSISTKHQNEPSKIPYWNDSKHQPTIADKQSNEQGKNYENTIESFPVREDIKQESSYWEDNKFDKSNSSKQHVYEQDKLPSNEHKYDTVLDNVWTRDNLSPPDHRVPPIPSFYERIYPIHTPPSSPHPKASTIEENRLQTTQNASQVPSSNIINQTRKDSTEDDNDLLPSKLNNQGISNYDSLTTPASATENKIGAMRGSPPSNQKSRLVTDITALRKDSPMPSMPFTSNTVSSSNVTNKVSSPSMIKRKSASPLNFLHSPISSPHIDRSITIPPAFVSAQELRDIQNALSYLDISSDSIITIEKAQYLSSGNITVAEIPYSLLRTYPPTGKKEHQPRQQQVSTLHSIGVNSHHTQSHIPPSNTSNKGDEEDISNRFIAATNAAHF